MIDTYRLNFHRSRGAGAAGRTAGPKVGRRRLWLQELEPRFLMTGGAVAGAAAQLTAQQASGENAVADSINAFAFDLYAQLQSENGGNLFVSPLSISTALAMADAGARGETATQMADALHLSLDPDAVAAGYGALLNDLNSAGQAGGYALNLANALWAQQGFDLSAPFVNLIDSDYGGALKEVDFKNATEAARQTINQWVQDQTNNKIQNLIPQGVLDQYTRLVLTNAIYFKSAWAAPFDPASTTSQPFTLASGDQVEASTMHQTSGFRYMQRDGFQVVELPYANGRLAMDVLLPTAGTSLSSIDANLVPEKLDAWLQGLSSQRVAVSLPKFQVTTQFLLSDALKALGMTDAFSDQAADFSGISDEEKLKISQVVHKAFIDIDEAGTEAAAATGVSVGASVVPIEPPPIAFRADHPFLYLIRDTQTGSVLFMGQVMDPTQSGDSSGPVITTHQPKVEDPGPIETPAPAPWNPSVVSLPPVTTNPADPVSSSPPVAVSPPVFLGPVLTVGGSSGASAPSPAEAPTSNEQFVEAVYQKLLDRPAEPAALANWSQQLDQGAARADVVSAIESSAEYRQDEVQAAYQHYLGRAADPAGLDFFTAQLAAGGTLDQLAASLAGSSEYLQAHGGQAGFLEAMFADALGRAADAQAQTYFAQELAAGATRAQLAAQIFASNEYQQSLTRALYARFLDRPADPAGLEQLAGELHAGTPRPQVIAQLVSSQEFFEKAQS